MFLWWLLNYLSCSGTSDCKRTMLPLHIFLFVCNVEQSADNAPEIRYCVNHEYFLVLILKATYYNLV